jgi:undecaprenyl-diphosphatase
MDALMAVLLGVVQGITEWLPVSSSGHLVIAQELLGLDPDENLVFDLAVHMGTLLAVCVYFRRELGRIIHALLRPGDKRDDARALRRLGMLILLGTVPVAVVGFALSDRAEDIFTLPMVGAALVVNAAVLLVAERSARRADRKHVGAKDALAAGVLQAASIVPGISRSGLTISGGMFSGLEKETAATFAFLLSVPALLGAFAYGLVALDTYDLDVVTASVGAVAAFATGFVSIGYLLKAVRSSKLWVFSVYCVVVGAAVLLLTL